MNKDWDYDKKVDWCCAVMLECDKNEVNGDDTLEVKPSLLKNAGNGLFAKKAIPKGVPITKYPIHFLIKCKDEERLEMAWCPSLYGEITEVDASAKAETLLQNNLIISEGIRGMGDTTFINNKVLCGHMANDRGFNPYKEYKESLNNSYFYLGDVWSVRDIEEGEEIYVSYGKQYWYGDTNHKSRCEQFKSIIEQNGYSETSGDTADTEDITD